MKKYKNYIIGFLVFASLSFLYGFASKRNSTRKIEDVIIEFTEEENLYITETAVNNLLIQNKLEVTSIGKDTLDLNKVETVLNNHDLIEKAEVYITIDGKMGAKIAQRKPIARVLSNNQFYIDLEGEKMPLSPYYSARVPLISGVSEGEIKEVYPIVDYIKNDDFLTKHVTGIRRSKNGFYTLEIREMDFMVHFGVAGNIDLKFKNLKAFYQNGLKNNKLNLYKTVNLQFGNQVVATKK